MKPVDLTILAKTKTKRSLIMVDGASQWMKLEIKGWRYVISQTKQGVLNLTPAGHLPISMSGVDLPDTAVGQLDLEIVVEKDVWICGSDNLLVINSPKEGPTHGIFLHCVPTSQAELASTVKIVPIR